MQISFILVEPARAENIGFAARALQTMGFQDLRIVNSEAHLQDAARKTAYGAHKVLDKIKKFESFKESLRDVDISIATTAKTRIKRYDYHHPRDLKNILSSKQGALKTVALVFGSEENGLTTEQIASCDLLSTIPLTQLYPSLNLAQSVLIYAYEMSGLQQPAPAGDHDPQLQAKLKQQGGALLDQIGLDEKPLIKQRMLDRILTANAEDMALLMSFISKITRALNQSSQSSKEA